MEYRDRYEINDFIDVHYYESCNVLDISCTEDNIECVVQLDKETLGKLIYDLQLIYNKMH